MRAAALAIIAVALAACEATVTDGDVGGGGNPSTCDGCEPDRECPASAPTPGDACEGPVDCDYTELHGEECDEYAVERHFVCYGLEWVELSSRCSEYEPECPLELPLVGSYCDMSEADLGTCVYDVEGCEPSSVAYADCDYESKSWQVTLPGGACVECGYTNVAACAAAEGCRWVEPACDEPATFEPFCAPDIQCADSPCSGVDLCVEYVANDCWGASSEPYCCDGTAGVCEPPPPGGD